MELKQILMFALKLSVFSTVFGFGLHSGRGELSYLIRRPWLLVRSLLAVFVIMPVFAIALVLLLDLRPAVEIALVGLAISPVPPLLPKKMIQAGGPAGYGLGLMAALALSSVVAVPLALEMLERVFGRQLGIAPGAVAAIALQTTLAPLAAGVAVRALLPRLAARIEKPVALAGKVLLPPAVVALLAAALPAFASLIGAYTLLAMAVFTVAGLVIGHILGGPDRDQSAVLALATASRHPAIALTVAGANFPDQRFGAAILLYLLVNAVTVIPYVKWQQRRAARAAAAAG